MKKTALALLLALAAPALAALPSTVSHVDATANGTATAFTFTFPVTTSAAHVEVLVGGVKQVAGYTVALNANQTSSPGGTVTFAVAPGASAAVRIQRTVPLTQETVFTPYSAFPAKTTEKALDRIVMQQQQLDRRHADLDAAKVDKTTQAAKDDAQDAFALETRNAQSYQGIGDATSVLATGGSVAKPLADWMADGPVRADGTTVLATGGTTARSLAARFADAVNVKDFGAVGDGIADDTAAVQAAVNAVVAAGGGRVRVPTGKYKLTNTVDFYAAGTPRGVSLSGEADAAGESGTAAGTIFVWHGANDRPVFRATGSATRGLRFAGFLLHGAGPFGAPTNPYRDAFWVAPTNGFAAHQVSFERLWVRDFTRTAFMLGDPAGSTYNGQMANSSMRDVWAAGYGAAAKVIWAKGGTSEDFNVYNLAAHSVSGDDKANHITTEGGFYISIFGLLTDGLEDAATSYSILAKSSVSVYQWTTEDLRLYDTVSGEYGHTIVLSGVRMLSSEARHGGTVRDAVVWRGYRITPDAWEDVPLMLILGSTFNGNVVWSSAAANQSHMSAFGVNFATGGFVFSGTNQRGLIHDAVKGTLRLSGPNVAFEQMTEAGASRFAVDRGAVYLRRNTPANITPDQNDYSLGAAGTYFRLTPSGADRTITGLADGADGRVLILRNVSATHNLLLANESASSAEANRIVTTTGADVTIAPGKTAQLIYDSPTSRWVITQQP